VYVFDIEGTNVGVFFKKTTKSIYFGVFLKHSFRDLSCWNAADKDFKGVLGFQVFECRFSTFMI